MTFATSRSPIFSAETLIFESAFPLGLTVTVSQIDIDKFCCIEKLLYLKWNNHIRENKGIDESIIFIKDRLNNIYKANKKDKTKVKTIRFFSSSYEQ